MSGSAELVGKEEGDEDGSQEDGSHKGQDGPVHDKHDEEGLEEDGLLILGRSDKDGQDEPVARVAPAVPILLPLGEAAQIQVEKDEDQADQGTDSDAHVESGVVVKDALLVVLGIVVVLGALDGRLVGDEIARSLITHHALACIVTLWSLIWWQKVSEFQLGSKRSERGYHLGRGRPVWRAGLSAVGNEIFPSNGVALVAFQQLFSTCPSFTTYSTSSFLPVVHTKGFQSRLETLITTLIFIE